MTQTAKTILISILVSIAVISLLGKFILRQAQDEPMVSLSKHEQNETAFERVMRTGVIRCAYMNWLPNIAKDPNSGEMRGIMADYMAAIADVSGLKVEWAEELNLATYIQDLNNHKYDLECSGGWQNARRGKELDYSQPIFYFPVVAVARADDLRFDQNLKAINDPNIKIATIDGETSELIRLRRFPESQAVGLPSLSPASDLMLQVATGKADVTFNDLAGVALYMHNNPGKIRLIDLPPMRVIPLNISFAKGEHELQQFLNTATDELMHDGVIDRILDKYQAIPGQFLRVAKPYQTFDMPSPKS